MSDAPNRSIGIGDAEVAELNRAADRTEWEALAAWLRRTARHLERHLPAWRGENWRPGEPAPYGYDNPGWAQGTVDYHYGEPLQVARDINAEDA